MKALVPALFLVSLAAPAPAQYLRPHSPPPVYEVPAYPPPPPYRRHIRFGDKCDALLPTRDGPEQLVCPIIRAKPLGEPCACPPPRGYPWDRFIPGRTVR